MKLSQHWLIKSSLLMGVLIFGYGCSGSSGSNGEANPSNLTGASSVAASSDNNSNDSSTLEATKDTCDATASPCELNPTTDKPAVITILMALVDIVSDKTAMNNESTKLIIQNSVRAASPVKQPKILVVKDFYHNGESVSDTEYIAKELQAIYTKVDLFIETPSGLKSSDLDGYDLIWFSNPGYPMGSANSRDALINFKGGVILSGDDLAWGNGFSTEALTGLKYIDNGTSASCNGETFNYDNNSNRYQIKISAEFLPKVASEFRSAEYTNDIDNSAITDDKSKNVEVLAYAEDKCSNQRPVIVRYVK